MAIVPNSTRRVCASASRARCTSARCPPSSSTPRSTASSQRVLSLGEREIPSRQFGEMVMEELYKLDKVGVHPLRIGLPVVPGCVRLSRRAEGSRSDPVRAQGCATSRRDLRRRTSDRQTTARYMARALALAERGLYTTTPNPRVGCVIVRDGADHRRRMASSVQAKRTRKSPRSPMRARRVTTCGARRSTSRSSRATVTAVRRRASMRLSRAGDRASRRRDARSNPAQADRRAADCATPACASTSGCLRAEARELNVGFVSRMMRGLPWVRSKIAASLDGRTALANGESRWITGAAARADGHAWRARACAMLTGVGTVLHDDPQLTVRDVSTTAAAAARRRRPPRDSPPRARVLDTATRCWSRPAHATNEWPSGVATLALAERARVASISLRCMRELARRGINEVHVEAGAKLNGALIRAGLVDELVVYRRPADHWRPGPRNVRISRAAFDRSAARVRLEWMSVDRIGNDLRIVARVRLAPSRWAPASDPAHRGD